MDVNQLEANDGRLHQADQALKTSQTQQVEMVEQAAKEQETAKPKDAYTVSLSPESQKLAEEEAAKPEKLLEQGGMV